MDGLFHFAEARSTHPEVEQWLNDHSDNLGAIARHWFDVLRGIGEDVRELIHDGAPTACVADAAFAYVNAYKAHVNIGFFRGAELADPNALLEGSGKYMRHVKIRPDQDLDNAALSALIQVAHADMQRRLAGAQSG